MADKKPKYDVGDYLIAQAAKDRKPESSQRPNTSGSPNSSGAPARTRRNRRKRKGGRVDTARPFQEARQYGRSKPDSAPDRIGLPRSSEEKKSQSLLDSLKSGIRQFDPRGTFRQTERLWGLGYTAFLGFLLSPITASFMQWRNAQSRADEKATQSFMRQMCGWFIVVMLFNIAGILPLGDSFTAMMKDRQVNFALVTGMWAFWLVWNVKRLAADLNFKKTLKKQHGSYPKRRLMEKVLLTIVALGCILSSGASTQFVGHLLGWR